MADNPVMPDVYGLEGSERLYMPDAIPQMFTALDNYEKNPSDENYDKVHEKSEIYRIYVKQNKVPDDIKIVIRDRINKIVDETNAKGGSYKKSKKSKKSKKHSNKSRKSRKTKSRRH